MICWSSLPSGFSELISSILWRCPAAVKLKAMRSASVRIRPLPIRRNVTTKWRRMRSGGLSIPAAYQHRWATNTGGLTTPAGAQPDPFTLRQVAKEAAEDAYAGKVYPPMRDRMFKLLGQGGDFTARRDFNAMLVAEFADVADG